MSWVGDVHTPVRLHEAAGLDDSRNHFHQRTWLLQQDFSDAQPSGNWSEDPLRWVDIGASGNVAGARTIDIVHDGQKIGTLTLQPLPDYCPNCDPNVVPFWGVMSWRLDGASSPATSSASG